MIIIFYGAERTRHARLVGHGKRCESGFSPGIKCPGRANGGLSWGPGVAAGDVRGLDSPACWEHGLKDTVTIWDAGRRGPQTVDPAPPDSHR